MSVYSVFLDKFLRDLSLTHSLIILCKTNYIISWVSIWFYILFISYQLRSSFTKVLIVIHCDLHWSFDDIWQSLWEIFVIWIEILWRRWDILLKSVEMYFKKLIAQCCFKWSDYIEEEHTGWGFSVFCDRIPFILNSY